MLSLGFLYVRLSTDPHSDFDQLWFAARALWAGRDPYELIGPGREFAWPWPLYYPATALLAVSPLALLPLAVARAVFATLSAGLLAYGVTRENWARVPLFASAAYYMAVGTVQWSLILVAAAFIPELAAIFAAKPNVGLAFVARDASLRTLRWAVAGGLIITAISIALRPAWPLEWYALLRTAPGFDAPVMYLGGPLLLLAVLRWRTSEGRFLLALSLVPHNVTPYALLLLFVIPRTFRESLALAALTGIALGIYMTALSPPSSPAAVRYQGDAFVVLCYLPCLWMVLRRPNERSESEPKAGQEVILDVVECRS